MNLIQAILMGIIQGVTEFLPVSSSGHLVIFQYIFGIHTETGMLFEVMLHLGTLAAVCVAFWKDIKKLFVAAVGLIADSAANIKDFIVNRGKTGSGHRRLIVNAYRKFALLVLVTSIPTGVIGIILSRFMDTITGSLLVPGLCLIVTAILLLIADVLPGGQKKVKATGCGSAAAVGLAQGIAVLPGLSRSGTTITACLALGFDRAFAVKYSFIASIPAIVGANLLELRHLGTALAGDVPFLYYIIGMIIAGVLGYICIKVMLHVVRNKKFIYFAYYCGIVGTIALIRYFFL